MCDLSKQVGVFILLFLRKIRTYCTILTRISRNRPRSVQMQSMSPRQDPGHDKQGWSPRGDQAFLNVVFWDSERPTEASLFQFSWSIITSLSLSRSFSHSLTLSLSHTQSQHFNYTWMRHVRQQDLCVAPQGNGFALQLCDKAKTELRWFHKSSKSALVG